jgi:uncharacterized membrane protein
MEECIICFDNIQNNTSNIYLECCKNYVHDNCLQLWISTNIDKNKDINLCIYCKKQNINITKIINNYNKLLPNNTEIIIINNDNYESNTSNNNNNNEIIIANNRTATKTFSLTILLLIFLFFLYILFY